MKKVITYGTFDLFHKGHYNILKRAKDHGDYLVVGVTGENYDIGRGKLNVHDTLATRIENVKKTGLADEIIVEEYLGQKIDDIIKYDIDAFVIGDDWVGKFDHLSKYCEMIYLERTKGISSTQIRQETFDHYDIGIVCDIADDNRIIEEAKLLSGFEVKNVYFDDETISEDFQKKYDVENVCGTFDELLDSSDIIYLRCCLEKRKDYITKAMNAKKHVVYDPPATIDPDELEELFRLAQENNVILMQNIKMVHIYIFNQLLWMTQAGLIGDLLSFNCSISKMDEGRSNLFYDLSVFCLLPMLKIMGQDYVKSDFKVTKNEDVIEFASMYFDYPKGISVINVGNNIRVNNQLEIIGTEGTIRMEGDWWKSKRFEIHTPGLRDVQVFSTNFDGDGFKYLIKELSRMLATNRINTKTILNDESLMMVEIFKEISEKK